MARRVLPEDPLGAYEPPGPGFAPCPVCGDVVQTRVWQEGRCRALPEAVSSVLGVPHLHIAKESQ